MSLRLYMDVHVRRSVTSALRLRGVHVVTAQEDGASQVDDHLLLDRAMELDCVLFTQDDDLLQEAAKRQRHGQPFFGVIYAHQMNVTVRQTVDDLALMAKACDTEELNDRVVFLPLK